MALILICGQPSSGKSTLTARLAELLSEAGRQVQVVDEPSMHLDRNESYKDVVHEKNTRGTLRSAVHRELTRSKVVILDSLNNIKGYRYELWCIARAAGTRYGVLHCDVTVETAREWNQARDASTAYRPEVFDDLASRFERPDARQRWDAPLFTVQPNAEESEQEQVLQDLVSVITQAGAVAQGVRSANLTPTMATTSPGLASTNLQFEIDRAAQEVLTAITEAQAAASGGPIGRVLLGDGIEPLHLARPVTVPELRRHKRAFLKLATQILSAKIQDPAAAKRMFADYLREHEVAS